LMLLEVRDEMIAGKTFNVGKHNFTITTIAEIVQNVVRQKMPGREQIEISTSPSDDVRSYFISSEKIKRELDFVPQRCIEDAVCDLVEAFRAGKILNPMTDKKYYNIKTMQDLQLNEYRDI